MIYDVKVPYDGRDPRVFKNQNYVLTEGYILDGIEMGWDLPFDRTRDGETASQGWRAEFANRIYLAQQRRFEQTGVITARSEHQVDGSPYFVYDSIFADGYAWNTLDPTGEYQPDRAAVSAAFTRVCMKTAMASFRCRPPITTGSFWPRFYTKCRGRFCSVTMNICRCGIRNMQAPISAPINATPTGWKRSCHAVHVQLPTRLNPSFPQMNFCIAVRC